MLESNIMQALKARIKNGQLVLDQPLNLPEGHELEVHLSANEMSDDERVKLHASIVQGIEDGEAGLEMDAADFLRELASEP